MKIGYNFNYLVENNLKLSQLKKRSFI